MAGKTFDKDHPSQFDKVKEITDKLEAGIQALFESEAFKNYLKTLSKFHDYSLNNTILIAMQKPDATLVAGYTAWQKNFGRQVQKGETGIRILAPTPYKKQMEVDRVDPVTQQPVLNPDGSTAKDLKEIMVPAFKVVNVFDVSQTDGKPLPTIGVDELSGNVTNYEMFFKALKRACPVPVGFEDIPSGAKGYYHTVDQRIALQEGMSQVQTVKTMIHEMAHQKLHAIDQKELPPEEPRLTRNAKEVEAEAVAYTVAQHYHIETSDYSFAYIAGWSKDKDTPELKASLDRIDPSTGQAVLNPDGSTAKDLKEVMVPAFKVVNVFDVSQTDGRELPTIGVNELTGDVAQYENFFEALKRACPVPIGFEEISSGAKGYYHTVDQRIALQEGMSQVQTIKTLIHEMAHQKLHAIDPKDLPPEEPRLTRNAKEVEAESVAYTVAQHYGIETSDYSFAYIAGWSKDKDTPELKASLDRIRKAADEMITAIDEQFLIVQREKAPVAIESPGKTESSPIEPSKTQEKASVLKELSDRKAEARDKNAHKKEVKVTSKETHKVTHKKKEETR